MMVHSTETAARGVRRAVVRAFACGALLAACGTAFVSVTAAAQEGFPLKGSWLGSWAGNAQLGDNILLILDWDGKNITGMINPGTDNIPVAKASLDPNGWVVKIEADAKDKSGAAVHYVIDGKIENIELPNRSIVGSWSGGKGKGAFEVSRQ
jgi:hypothetical protein